MNQFPLRKKRSKSLVKKQRNCTHAQRKKVTIQFANGTLHLSNRCQDCGHNKLLPWDKPGQRPNREQDLEDGTNQMRKAIDCCWRHIASCTERQKKFIESVTQQFESHGWVSGKQFMVLNSISQRASAKNFGHE